MSTGATDSPGGWGTPEPAARGPASGGGAAAVPPLDAAGREHASTGRTETPTGQGVPAAEHDSGERTRADGGEPAPGSAEAPPGGRLVPEEQLRRALADLDNLRKRYARQAAQEREAERARVLAEWLPVVDDLGRALEHAGDDCGPVVEGVRGVYMKAQALLERLGYPPFDDTGKPFDASRHEVVAVVEDGGPAPGTIVATVRPGYGTPDRLLRPAGVVVARPAA